MTHERTERGRLNWLLPWIITASISGFFYLANERITALEKRMTKQEEAQKAQQLQYVEDRASLLEGQRQILHDMRVLCGSKNLNMPCPEE